MPRGDRHLKSAARRRLAKKASNEAVQRQEQESRARHSNSDDGKGAERRLREQPVGGAEDKRYDRDSADKPRDSAKWTDIALVFVGLIALVVSYWQWRIGRDQLAFAVNSAKDSSKDTQAALAVSRRIAAASEDQAGDAADSARAAKDTATIARRQTSAIVQQANALITGAQATIKAADAELASAKANTQTAEAGGRAAQEQLRAATLISQSQAPSAAFDKVFIPGFSTDADGVEFNLTLTMRNTGAVTIFPVYETLSITFGVLPPDIPGQDQITMGGNDLVVAPNETWANNNPIKFKVSLNTEQRLKSGEWRMFFWGKSVFRDKAGNIHTVCYAETAVLANGVSIAASYALHKKGYECEPT